VSRAFGDTQYKDNKDLAKDQQKVIALPDVSLVYLQADEFLFICCDGIFEALSNEGVMEFLHQKLSDSQDLAGILSDLETAVLKGGSRDNMSAMLIQLSDGTDYNRPDEFLVGTYYMGGNDSYQLGFRLDLEKHGLKWEEVEKNLHKSSELDSDLALSARSLPSLAQDKPMVALKTQSRTGISKSSRQLVVSPNIFSGDEKEAERLLRSPTHNNHTHHHHHPTDNVLSHSETPKEKEKERTSVFRFNLLSKSVKKEKKSTPASKSKTVILGKSKK
jgi:hypothetical protein